jgi:hypothetical protein
LGLESIIDRCCRSIDPDFWGSGFDLDVRRFKGWAPFRDFDKVRGFLTPIVTSFPDTDLRWAIFFAALLFIVEGLYVARLQFLVRRKERKAR